MDTQAGSAPSSPRTEPPTITVEEHVDAPANPVEEAKVEGGTQEAEEVKGGENGTESADNAATPEPDVISAVEAPLPPSPQPEPEPAVAADNTASEPRDTKESPVLEASNVSGASNKDLPLPPVEEATLGDASANERVEESPPVLSEQPPRENGSTTADLPNSPEVVVRAPSTDIPAPAPSESSAPGAPDNRPSSVPPPIPEKIKSPTDRSSAAGFSQHRNASVSSVRTSTPGPGARHSISSLPDRRSSASVGSHRTNGSRSFVSPVVVTSALETIAASREAKRSTPFKDSVTHALELVKSGRSLERPREIFEPLRMAVETHNEKLMVTGLDCIAKLVSHGFFAEDVLPEHAYNSPPPSPAPGATPSSRDGQSTAQMPLADLVTNTITSAYTDSTPDPVSLQIVKALLSLVLSPTILVHHSSLLKAVRTVYNVFLLSNDPVNQMVAQGGLTQMVNHVFARCKIGENASVPESAMPSRPASRGPLSARGVPSHNASASASVVSLGVPQAQPTDGTEEQTDASAQSVVSPAAETPTSTTNGAAEAGSDLEIVEPTEGSESVTSPTQQNLPGRL
ncbi:guanine nucleotide exchange protein for ADP-robosylation factor [Ceratobasidium sp. 394]|nr:guanine nucleotide exchange protein for ADP-robosylation factor [Ceratobasidium sp. 394]